LFIEIGVDDVERLDQPEGGVDEASAWVSPVLTVSPVEGEVEVDGVAVPSADAVSGAGVEFDVEGVVSSPDVEDPSLLSDAPLGSGEGSWLGSVSGGDSEFPRSVPVNAPMLMQNVSSSRMAVLPISLRSAS